MKALLAAAVALAGLQGCDPGGGGPKCDAISAKASPLLIYVVGHVWIPVDEKRRMRPPRRRP